MVDPSIVPTDSPPLGQIAVTLVAITRGIWQLVRRLNVDASIDRLNSENEKQRQDLRDRIKDLEKENKELHLENSRLSGTSGAASGSVDQMQKRLTAVENALHEAEDELEDALDQIDEYSRIVDSLTIHMVKMSFYMESVRGALPDNPNLKDLKIDLPEVLADIDKMKSQRRPRVHGKKLAAAQAAADKV